VGAHAVVAPHSVIMKREHLLPGCRYEGAPTRASNRSARPGEIRHAHRDELVLVGGHPGPDDR